jgi:hypothetical protein
LQPESAKLLAENVHLKTLNDTLKKVEGSDAKQVVEIEKLSRELENEKARYLQDKKKMEDNCASKLDHSHDKIKQLESNLRNYRIS